MRNKSGLVSALVTALAVGAATTAFMSPRMAVAGSINNWNSYLQVVPAVDPIHGNPINSTVYTSSSTISAPNNLSAVYFVLDGGVPTPVGGFNVVNGQVTSASFNTDGEHNYGLKTGDTANTGAGANYQNTYAGYWEVFYDANGDGGYGLADTSVQGVFIDRNEQLDTSQYSISNFTPYGDSNPTFSFTADPVPEPSSLALIAVGAVGAALRRRFGKRDKSAKPSGK